MIKFDRKDTDVIIERKMKLMTSMVAGRELPILFSTSMVQAIKNDWKIVTRRIVETNGERDRPAGYAYAEFKHINGVWRWVWPEFPDHPGVVVKPKYNKGDILWVRESWAHGGFITSGPGVIFRDPHMEGVTKWKPSIHMRKEYARIWLQVTQDPFAERLHDIPPEDAIREGYPPAYNGSGTDRMKYIRWFKKLWIDINGEDSWISNPYVWRYAFKVLSKTGRPDGI